LAISGFRVPCIGAHGWEILEQQQQPTTPNVHDHVNVHVDVHVLVDVDGFLRRAK
jgi:hypothetical protein